MDILKEFWNAYGVAILRIIVTAVFSYVGIAVKTLYKKYVTSIEKRKIVTDVVRAVEQMYQDLDGPQKLEAAKNGAMELLNAKGIKITDFELRMLIEAAVSGFNYSFGTGMLLAEPIEAYTDEDDEEDKPAGTGSEKA